MKQPVDSRLPRVAFDFIVKSEIKIFVWSVDKSNDFYLACRGDLRSSEVVSVITAYPSMAARRFMKHELWLQKSVALD